VRMGAGFAVDCSGPGCDPRSRASGRKMRTNRQRVLWLSISILGSLSLSPVLLGQAAPRSEAAVPVTTDWSQHHLIFSRPGTPEQTRRVQRDPRYWQQLARHAPARLPAAENSSAALRPAASVSATNKKIIKDDLKRDWSQDLGISPATVGAGNYPAKFSFDGTTANCANDFVVYNTGLFGSASKASIVAYNNLYSGCTGLAMGSAANFALLGAATITNSGNTVVTGGNIGISPGTSLTGFGPGVLTPPATQQLGNPVAAQAQADANTAYTHYQGLTGAALIAPVLDGLTFTPGLYKAASTLSLSGGATVTLNGSGTYIFQIGSTLEITGTVALTGGATAGNVIWLVGSSATLDTTGIAAGTIIAAASITFDGGASLAGRAIALSGAITLIDNAVTLSDTVPSVYWAYNTVDKIQTSPMFSLDGTQIAFVQTNGVPASSLVLLKWAPSTTQTVDSPQTLTRVTRFAYLTCTAPCFTSIALPNLSLANDTDTNSSVFYDYADDVAYVGDDSGLLHKFTPVFKGQLAEVRTGWPVQVSPNPGATALTDPVYDSGSGNVFVEDKGGFLYRVSSTTGVVTQSGQLDFSVEFDGGGPGFVQGPIVDSTAGFVYAFATSDGSERCPVGVGGADCSAVYQLPTNFSPTSTGSEALVGTSSVEPTPPNPLYIGAFDSTYENSVNARGNLYVCGNTGGPPILYQVAIQGNVLGHVTPGPVLSTSTSTPCSPVTDVLNLNSSGGATERLFASAQNGGGSSACSSGGCIFNFTDTPWQASTVYTVGQEILDSNLHIEVVAGVTGPSGATVPFWTTSPGANTTDGGVTWLFQGALSVFTPAAWVPNNPYIKGAIILDPNGNIQLVTTSPHGGSSGGTIPTFNATAGGTTTDGTIIWTNVGAIATAALAATGGTSGIIMDNTVGFGVLPGASQIYFSTLSGGCGSGTDGCAVQASQSALQ
jgi:hypothetical protein